MAFLKRSGGRFELRKKSADERKSDRGKRTSEQQIAILDKKFGKGVGAKRERERLLNKKVTPVVSAENVEKKIDEVKEKKKFKKGKGEAKG